MVLFCYHILSHFVKNYLEIIIWKVSESFHNTGHGDHFSIYPKGMIIVQMAYHEMKAS